jgi:hypothetical protein
MPQETPPDPDGLSPDYACVKARMDAHELWEAMSAVERRELILDTYPPQQWCDEPQLSTLAGFRLDAVQWGRILAQFRAIGGWPADLEKAVDAALGLPRSATTPAMQAWEVALNHRMQRLEEELRRVRTAARLALIVGLVTLVGVVFAMLHR